MEFFVSQTPELAAVAAVAIDLKQFENARLRESRLTIDAETVRQGPRAGVSASKCQPSFANRHLFTNCYKFPAIANEGRSTESRREPRLCCQQMP